MSGKDFALNLILQDEMRRMREQESNGDGRQVIVLQQENFTHSGTYTIRGEDALGESYVSPFEFKGYLDTFIFKSPSQQFNATVEVDEFDVLNRKPFSDILDITTELSHVGAYQRDGNNVLSVSAYPFNRRLHLQLELLEEMTVDIVRTEIVKGASSDGDDVLDPETASILEGI